MRALAHDDNMRYSITSRSALGEDNDERLPETLDRLHKEDVKFQNFWVGISTMVDSYRQQKRKPEREPSKFVHSVQHPVVSKHCDILLLTFLFLRNNFLSVLFFLAYKKLSLSSQ